MRSGASVRCPVLVASRGLPSHPLALALAPALTREERVQEMLEMQERSRQAQLKLKRFQRERERLALERQLFRE